MHQASVACGVSRGLVLTNVLGDFCREQQLFQLLMSRALDADQEMQAFRGGYVAEADGETKVAKAG